MKNLVIHIILFVVTIPFAFSREYVDHKSVNQKEVAEAICKRDFLENPSNLQNAIASIAGNEQSIDENVFGIHLSDENPNLVQALKNLFTRRGHYQASAFIQPQVDIVKDLGVRNCKKVECVVKQVWGEERGQKILWIMLRYGFNTSEFAYDDSETPTNDELDDIITTLDLLPPSADKILLGRNAPFLAFKNITGTQELPASNVLANSSIYFFDLLRSENSEYRIQSFLHELGHMFSNNINTYNEWRKISGWHWDGDKTNRCIVSRYGNTSAEEDFAETFNMYRVSPERLKSKCPQKYEYMKNQVFKIEYSGLKSCKFQDKLAKQEEAPTSVTAKHESGISTLDLNRIDKITAQVTNAIKLKSRLVKSIKINFEDGHLNRELLERNADFEHKLEISLTTISRKSLVYDCNFSFKLFGAEALLYDCRPVDHSVNIKSYLAVKKNSLVLPLK